MEALTGEAARLYLEEQDERVKAIAGALKTHFTRPKRWNVSTHCLMNARSWNANLLMRARSLRLAVVRQMAAAVEVR